MPVEAAPDRDRQDRARPTRTTRTSRRWSARSISASSSITARTTRTPTAISGGLNRTTQGMLEFVEMFKAPIKVLHPLLTATQEGNYLGTESDRRLPLPGHHPGPFQRGGMAAVQGQQEQRGLPRPHLRGQGALLPAGLRRDPEDLREAAATNSELAMRLRAPRFWRCWPLQRPAAAVRARELQPLFQDAGLRRREPEGRPTPRPSRSRNTATRAASTRA